jgi:Carboxypeptidase regulatory-like domain
METNNARTPLMPGDQSGVYSLGSTEGSEVSIDGFDDSYFSFWAQTARETSVPERVTSGNHSLTLRVAPAAPLRGTVVDAASGAPLAGAEVCVRMGGGSPLPDGAVWTDKQGRFSLPNPPLCELRVWARAANHRADALAVPLDQRGSAVVRLQPTGGVMLRPDPALHGETFESRVVILRQREGSGQQTVVFNGRPQFLTDLAPGGYDVLGFRASTTAGEPTTVAQVLASIDVRGGQVSEVILHLPPGAPSGG